MCSVEIGAAVQDGLAQSACGILTAMVSASIPEKDVTITDVLRTTEIENPIATEAVSKTTNQENQEPRKVCKTNLPSNCISLEKLCNFYL